MKTDFSLLLEGFFLQWMDAGRHLSSRTIASYRDTFVLFLRWLFDARAIPAPDVTMRDLTAENVEAFLQFLALERECAATTVNCRLAAIKAFCGYAAYRSPDRLAEMKRIQDIPRRTEKRCEVAYLTAEEIGWLLAACDLGTSHGEETHVMLALLFSTGMRVSELVNLRVCDFESRGGRHVVRILGKGRKERTLPMWPEVAAEVLALADARSIPAGGHLLAGRNVGHLTRSGARSKIDAVVRRASETHPQLAGKRITPHVFRHSTAMAMLDSGVDLSTIAIWLGHENVQTTHRYMVANMARKEAALAKVHGCVGMPTPERYAPSHDVLDFLMSL